MNHICMRMADVGASCMRMADVGASCCVPTHLMLLRLS